jgi:enterochelin esterase-like enzyme
MDVPISRAPRDSRDMRTTRTTSAVSIALAVLSALALSALSPDPSRSEPAAPGTLSDNIVIESDALGYKLQYRVYVPEHYLELSDLPVIFITDGQWYIESGEMPRIIDDLITTGEIQPLIAVFVDNRDPAMLSNNRRNQQFFCNARYVDFFTDELIPTIDATYPTSADRADRVILGLSFGGLNSACFGLLAHDAFAGIAMQSPAMHPVDYILSAYADSTRLPINVFLSSGSLQDNEERTRRLRGILQERDYPLKYIEVPFGHNWDNWKPLIDDVLTYYFASTDGGS